jgi:hypothetical protein
VRPAVHETYVRGDVPDLQAAAVGRVVGIGVVFANRFKALKTEYDTRIGCANKIDQSLNDVALPDMTQASKVLKSMIDAIQGDANKVSAEEAKVVEFAERIANSQRAMVAIQKIHRSIV